MKHSTLSLISITMLLIHGIVYAQQAVNSAQLTTHQQQLLVKQAIFDANVDVRQQVSGMNWFLAGVFCQVWALGLCCFGYTTGIAEASAWKIA